MADMRMTCEELTNICVRYVSSCSSDDPCVCLPQTLVIHTQHVVYYPTVAMISRGG